MDKLQELINFLKNQFKDGFFFTKVENPDDISNPIVKAVSDLQDISEGGLDAVKKSIDSMRVEMAGMIPEKEDTVPDDGTREVTLKGVSLVAIKGDKGDQGLPGYTPVKFKDYFTNEEILSISRSIQKSIKVPKDGKDGVDGKDGKDGVSPRIGVDFPTFNQIQDLVENTVAQIPVPEDGFTPSHEWDSKKEKLRFQNPDGTWGEWSASLKSNGTGGARITWEEKFLSLTDTPKSYESQAGKYVRVKTTEDGLEFATVSGGGSPAGSNTQIQFNDGGAFGAEADLTWNKTTNILTIGVSGASGAITSDAGISVRSISGQQPSFYGDGSGIAVSFLGTAGATDDGADISLRANNGGATSGRGGNIILSPGNKVGGANPGTVNIQDPGTSLSAILHADLLTSDRNISFPDLSGTLAVMAALNVGDMSITGVFSSDYGAFYGNDPGGNFQLANAHGNTYKLRNNTGSLFNAILDTVNIVSVDRTFTLPDNDGTIALVSDIPTIPSNLFARDISYISGSGTFVPGSSSFTDYFVIIKGNQPIQLPPAAGGGGQIYFFKNDYSAPLTITPDAGDNIDGSNTPITLQPQDSILLQAESSLSWSIISTYSANVGVPMSQSVNETITSGFSYYVSDLYEIASGTFIDIGLDGVLEVG